MTPYSGNLIGSLIDTVDSSLAARYAEHERTHVLVGSEQGVNELTGEPFTPGTNPSLAALSGQSAGLEVHPCPAPRPPFVHETCQWEQEGYAFPCGRRAVRTCLICEVTQCSRHDCGCER